MKPIDSITESDFKNIKLIVLDVDGVLVPRGTIIEQIATRTTYETKRVASDEISLIKQLHSKGFHINISSGRSLFMLMDMFRDILPFVSITYENGSSTWFNGSIIQHVNSFSALRDIYPKLSLVVHKNIKGFEPKEFIITIHCTDRVPEIESISSLFNSLYFLWNGEAYDIGIKGIQTKGSGLKHLISHLNLKKENVLAIGDNLNDRELLDEAGIKITADKTKLQGDFYIPLPAEIVMRKILGELK